MTKENLEKLNHMGKAWFVLRYYNDHINPKDKRYTLCDTNSLKTRREPRYEETKAIHAELLLEVLTTRHLERLESNKLGITADEVISIAKQCVLSLI